MHVVKGRKRVYKNYYLSKYKYRQFLEELAKRRFHLESNWEMEKAERFMKIARRLAKDKPSYIG